MYKKVFQIKLQNGIHTRIAAMVVHKAEMLGNKFKVALYIKKQDSKQPLAISMLALISLKIQQNDIIEISGKGSLENEKSAVEELYNFITTDLGSRDESLTKIDAIIEQNTIANEQILQSIPIGIIVIDNNSCITTINKYALSIIDKSIDDVQGKLIKDIIPTTDLPAIIGSREYHLGNMQHINNHIVIVNRSPIFSGNEVIGAVGIFQDISELIGMKELNERFKKILECSHDMICFIDEDRKISYINPAYEQHFSIKSNDILGKDLMDISPNGLRMKVFNSKNTLENVLHHKDYLDIIATIQPIFIDNIFKGVISITKPVNEIKNLIKKLEASEEELNYYKEELKRHTGMYDSFKNIIGWSSSLQDVIVIAEKASQSTSTVLVRGESGTGKELIAKAIHSNSDRKDMPFVRVNCAAIPENLLESELFGYEKGAFTGAVKSKPGKFKIANNGTIFLDEIGDMPLAMQAKLLRVLQEKEFESVGGINTEKVDVRIIAATNRNLEEMIKNKQFREDLYYRLNVITIPLPPLRKRREDINLLVEHFIIKINSKLNKNIRGISTESLKHLRDYHWPGNIRELENIIERAINLCEGKIISSVDLPFYITNIQNSSNENLINLKNGELLPFEEYEKELIRLAMEKYKSFNRAGKALGLTHRTIGLKCKKYGIK